MNKLFKKHPDFVLISLTVIFLSVLIAYFFWGITALIVKLNAAVKPGNTNESALKFNLDEAARINLKGLVPKQ